MSDDPTKELGEKYETKPTLETILLEMRAGFQMVSERLDRVESRFDDFDFRLDRVASDTSKARSEMPELRADFKEFRNHLKSLPRPSTYHLARKGRDYLLQRNMI